MRNEKPTALAPESLFLDLFLDRQYKHETSTLGRNDGMAKSMTKAGIAEYLAEKFHLTKKAATQILDDLATLAYKESKNGFKLPGLGMLVLKNRKARMGRNPQTGEAIKIPAKRVVKFRIAKAAKDAILGKK
jgi:DNA-binding protein HU-beta